MRSRDGKTTKDKDSADGGSPEQPRPRQIAQRGGAGPKAVGLVTGALTRRCLGKRGFTETALIAEWPLVVGSLLGSVTLPTKIVFPRGERSGGTLHLRVSSGAFAMQVQHQSGLIIERINSYFGYGAVSRLTISQGPVPIRPRPQPPGPPQLSPAQEADLEARLAGIEDETLKAALAGLGRQLAAKPQ